MTSIPFLSRALRRATVLGGAAAVAVALAASPAGASGDIVIGAGKNADPVGSMTVERTDDGATDTIVVSYRTDQAFDESHLCVSDHEFTERIAPGQCQYQQSGPATSGTYTLTGVADGETVYLQLHVVTQGQTAYAGHHDGKPFYGNVVVPDGDTTEATEGDEAPTGDGPAVEHEPETDDNTATDGDAGDETDCGTAEGASTSGGTGATCDDSPTDAQDQAPDASGPAASGPSPDASPADGPLADEPSPADSEQDLAPAPAPAPTPVVAVAVEAAGLGGENLASTDLPAPSPSVAVLDSMVELAATQAVPVDLAAPAPAEAASISRSAGPSTLPVTGAGTVLPLGLTGLAMVLLGAGMRRATRRSA